LWSNRESAGRRGHFLAIDIDCKTDPITFAPLNRLYAVQVNANDIAAMGGAPCWFLAPAFA
jgi:hydrogenase maturation factor